MSDASLNSTPQAQTGDAGFGDFFALLKPRVMTLVVFTAFVGLLAAPGLCTRSSGLPQSSLSQSEGALRAL